MKEDPVLKLARNQCVELVRAKNDSGHKNVDAYEIIYAHDTFLPSIRRNLKRGWFIKGNKLYVYWSMR